MQGKFLLISSLELTHLPQHHLSDILLCFVFALDLGGGSVETGETQETAQTNVKPQWRQWVRPLTANPLQRKYFAPICVGKNQKHGSPSAGRGVRHPRRQAVATSLSLHFGAHYRGIPHSSEALPCKATLHRPALLCGLSSAAQALFSHLGAQAFHRFSDSGLADFCRGFLECTFAGRVLRDIWQVVD